MGEVKMKKPDKWSISALHCYEGCPRQYKAKYIKRMKDKPGPAAQRGLEIHMKAERYLDGQIRGLPRELENLAKHYRQLKKQKPLVELKMAVDKDWSPVSWTSGWCRGVVDAIVRQDDTMIVIDHKTGRIYEKHKEQAELYAALTSANSPVEEYHVEFWYIDQGETREWTFDIDDIRNIIDKYSDRASRMLTARRYPEKPGEFICKYCPDNSKRGGTCEGWRRV